MYEYLKPLESVLINVRRLGAAAGSSQYGWVKYKIPFLDLEVNYHDLHHKNGEEMFELSSPDLIISAKRVHTVLNPYQSMYIHLPALHDQVNVYWNNRIIKETKSRKTPYKTYIDHAGSLSAIAEAVASLSLLSD